MKKTALNQYHRSLGARMGEFSGWEMPIQYPAGIVARDFVGARALRKASPEKQLIGIELDSRRAVRSGSAVLQAGNIIGTVTSGSFAPSLGRAVALGYVSVGAGLEPGDSVEIDAGRKQVAGSVTQVPFYTQVTVRRDP